VQLRAATAVIAYDDVAEAVETILDRERVRRCLGSLTELQREAVTLAYYGGYTYRQVAGPSRADRTGARRRGTDPAAPPGHPRGGRVLAPPAPGQDAAGWLPIPRGGCAAALMGAEHSARAGRGHYGRRHALGRRAHRGAPAR